MDKILYKIFYFLNRETHLNDKNSRNFRSAFHEKLRKIVSKKFQM